MQNACNECTSAKDGLWQFARDLRGVQNQLGRKLSNSELNLAFEEWYRRSESFLDSAKSSDDYLEAFLAKLGKVHTPTGEGDRLNKALATVAKLSVDELPTIPGMSNAPERLRRGAALHRELFRLRGVKTYFLTCRDTAKLFPGLSHQAAWNMNDALAQLGVIEVVRAGDPHPGGRATQYRYLLPQDGNAEKEIAA
jgi:hypothetical protein